MTNHTENNSSPFATGFIIQDDEATDPATGMELVAECEEAQREEAQRRAFDKSRPITVEVPAALRSALCEVLNSAVWGMAESIVLAEANINAWDNDLASGMGGEIVRAFNALAKEDLEAVIARAKGFLCLSRDVWGFMPTSPAGTVSVNIDAILNDWLNEARDKMKNT